jgi:hypothetical protein
VRRPEQPTRLRRGSAAPRPGRFSTTSQAHAPSAVSLHQNPHCLALFWLSRARRVFRALCAAEGVTAYCSASAAYAALSAVRSVFTLRSAVRPSVPRSIQWARASPTASLSSASSKLAMIRPLIAKLPSLTGPRGRNRTCGALLMRDSVAQAWACCLETAVDTRGE